MQVVWDERGPGVIWENSDTGWNGYEPGDKGGFPLARPHITRSPHTDNVDPQPWCVWVPYLRPEHLDAPYPTDLDDWKDIVANASIVGPYGDTFWDTHAEAMEWLDGVLRDEDTACPLCGSNERSQHTLGPEFVVCGGCAEILHPYELLTSQQPAV